MVGSKPTGCVCQSKKKKIAVDKPNRGSAEEFRILQGSNRVGKN